MLIFIQPFHELISGTLSIRVPNGLGPGQARRSVCHDLGPN